MEIRYKKSVLKQITKIPDIDKKKVLRKIEILAENPYVGKNLKGDYEGFRSIRAWPYRIIYSINAKKKSITIFSIAHRQSVYN